MQKIVGIMGIVIFSILLLVSQIFGQEISDYLIVNDIQGFIASKNPSSGQGPGILAGAKHFYHDHQDMTYRISYFNLQTRVGPEIQVTQHAGSDSDKWLLHEVEDGYRDGEMERLGLVTQGARLRDINGNKIISLRGSGYSWISNNAVIEISYTDLDGTKPEPLEIIQAYLQKFPSTIPATLVLDQAHNEQWIKDEMDRRLWLADKWIARIETVGNLNELSSVVKSLNVFLDYREKYYGIEAATEKQTLSEYLLAKNKAGIKTKLEEYKTWWAANKDKPINL